MGLKNWMLRKSNIGSISRSVGKAWKIILDQNANISAKEIAETITATRYYPRNEVDLAKSAMNEITENITPIGLTMIFLANENPNEISTINNNFERWRNVICEEIEKFGIPAE